VDDDALLRTGLERTFGETFEVALFADANALLEALRTGRRFDVALVDLQLNRVSAAPLLQSLASEHPAVLARCVLMTGRSLDEVDPAVLDLVGWRVARKPFSARALEAYLLKLAQE
jgi:DNA-binding response OmpR family regulator